MARYILIRGHREAAWWVELRREVIERHHPAPRIGIIPTWQWQQAVAPRTHGDVAGGLATDVSVYIGVDEGQRWRRPLCERRAELIPRTGPIEGQQARYQAGLFQYRAPQGEL